MRNKAGDCYSDRRHAAGHRLRLPDRCASGATLSNKNRSNNSCRHEPRSREYVLGSPWLKDAFDNVWHYVYYLREGWNEPKQKQLTVVSSTTN